MPCMRNFIIGLLSEAELKQLHKILSIFFFLILTSSDSKIQAKQKKNYSFENNT